MSLVILPDSSGIGPTFETIQGIDPCAGSGVTIAPIDEALVGHDVALDSLLSSGYEEIHAVDVGCCVHLMDGTVTRDWSVTARNLHNCLRLRIAFSGSADFASTKAQVSDQGSRCTFIVQPAGTSMTGVFRADVAYRYCTIHLSQQFLEERLGLDHDDLPRALASGWSSRETALGHINLSRAALATAARLFSMSTRGVSRRIEVNAIALDLLHHVLDTWAGIRENSSTQVRLRPTERNQLSRLRDIAIRLSPVQISIAEAVELTGLNKNKVHFGFQQFFGMSLREFCFDLRMQQAKALLLNDTMSVADVAVAVGFSEPTNFTIAFRKQFGTLPSSFRRAGRLPAGTGGS